MLKGQSRSHILSRRTLSGTDTSLSIGAHRYNCPPGSPPPLTPYTIGGSRWFDVSNGAAVDWSWVAAINETWAVLSCTEGSVSASDPASWEKRVEVSVPDWSVIPKGVHVVSVRLFSSFFEALTSD